ncbi:hypothetical protein [Klebsiella sp. BIGb0407]|uniref:hypothetical protein n=1 Tax=Klebsiella sp. BIGb0407 TaxID=2940603 RepID=UPI002167C1E9|nr:hypothetical protein [Klebsiella sp. BIGb0407]MCS3433796.1 hypothetical protein [Klebsiella sp. BIGb0407]
MDFSGETFNGLTPDDDRNPKRIRVEIGSNGVERQLRIVIITDFASAVELN